MFNIRKHLSLAMAQTESGHLYEALKNWDAYRDLNNESTKAMHEFFQKRAAYSLDKNDLIRAGRYYALSSTSPSQKIRYKSAKFLVNHFKELYSKAYLGEILCLMHFIQPSLWDHDSEAQADYHWYCGQAAKDCRRYYLAIDAYTKALTLYPGDQNFLSARADTHMLSGNYRLAQHDYSQLIETNPNNTEYLCKLTYIHLKLKEKNMACSFYAAAVNIGGYDSVPQWLREALGLGDDDTGSYSSAHSFRSREMESESVATNAGTEHSHTP